MKAGKDSRICIIGAGASGITAGVTLHRLGYRHVTVLEKNEWIGGKCHTVTRDGIPLDVGGFYVLPHYPTVERFARQTKVHMDDSAPHIHIDETGGRRPFGHPRKKISLLAKGLEYVRIGYLLARYYPLLKNPYGEVNPALLAEMSLPYKDWIKKYRLEYFHETVYPILRSFGFGYEEHNLPAAYILTAIPIFAWKGNILALWDVAGVRLRQIREGHGEMWRRLAEPLDVRLGARVERVERNEHGGVVSTEKGRFEFDCLILSCALDESLKFLDASDEEQALFGQIRHLEIWQAAFQVKGVPEAIIFDERQAFLNIGYGMIMLRYRPDADWYYYFGYTGQRSDEEIVRSIKEDVARIGGKMLNEPLFRRWRYFPHFSGAQIADGAYARLEQLQGRRSTYYIGEIVSNFGVEFVSAGAERLVKKRFS